MRVRVQAAAVVLAAAAVLGACGSDDPEASPSTTEAAPGTTVPQVVLDAGTEATLQSTFESAFQATGMPGAAVFVSIGDDEWTSVLGVDDLATNAPFDPGAHTRIASITKTFTASAVLHLVKEGKVSLDDTLDEYVTGIANGDQITVRDMLGMRSGVWDFTSDEDLVARFDADPTMPWTVDQTIELIRQHEPAFAPGEKVVYADSNYVLLGEVIEKAAGSTADGYIRSNVIEALGLDDTNFPIPDETGVPEPAVTGYLPPPDGSTAAPTVVGAINPQFAWTAGNMTSTLDDLVVWARELSDGSLLTPALQAERLDSRKIDGQKLNLGYGLGVTTLNDLVWHDGAIIGYSTVVMRYPQADATIVVIGNQSTNFTTPTAEIALSFIQQLYPDQIH
ncbi:MAG TPA: serine hydrolase domain-containing protein [Acidimicrobiales bacterium]